MLLGIVNMSIEHPRQCELASSVYHVVARVRRKFGRLADPNDAAILDDQRAVADYSATRINSDEIVDVANDETRHSVKVSWSLFWQLPSD
jgi:hypothetical protein